MTSLCVSALGRENSIFVLNSRIADENAWEHLVVRLRGKNVVPTGWSFDNLDQVVDGTT
jgi:hypothetical protein